MGQGFASSSELFQALFQMSRWSKWPRISISFLAFSRRRARVAGTIAARLIIFHEQVGCGAAPGNRTRRNRGDQEFAAIAVNPWYSLRLAQLVYPCLYSTSAGQVSAQNSPSSLVRSRLRS